MNNKLRTITAATIAGLGLMASASAFADKGTCKEITWNEFTTAVDIAYEKTLTATDIVGQDGSMVGYGFGLGMWATLVDETGKICHVYSVDGQTATANGGRDAGNTAWLGSRVISAQKANTANAFSLDGLAISTGAVTVATYEGGSLFGLQASNPVDATKAYKGPSQRRGKKNDPLRGKNIGGINVFGGGVALYDGTGTKIGAVGVSGDTSCRDHSMAYQLRMALGYDNATLNDDALALVDPPVALFQQPSCGVNDPEPTVRGAADDNGIR